MRRGVDFLLSQFEEGEISLRYGGNPNRRAGLDALCVYAMLQASRSLNDNRINPKLPAMRLMLDKLKAFSMTPAQSRLFEPVVYARSLRAAALAVYDRPDDRRALTDDVKWLIHDEYDGAYSYGGRWMAPNAIEAPRPRVLPTPMTRGRGASGGKQPASNYRPPVVAQGPSPWMRPRPPEDPKFLVPPPVAPGQPSVPTYPQVPTRGGGPAPRGGPSGNTNTPSGGGSPTPGGTAGQPGYVAPPSTDAPSGGYTGGCAAPANQPANPNASPRIVGYFPWDNSNSQYGLFGVWSGAEVGIEVPAYYWRDVERHWLSWELRTGEWGYRENNVTGSLAMNCAGVASLLVTHDYIQAPELHGAVGREIFSPGLAAGLDWLEAGNNCMHIPDSQTHYMGYTLYGIERVGLASGFKYLGTHDWYRELTRRVLPMQFHNGAWGRTETGENSVIDTAYVLLFLSSGRNPIFMNKLRFDGAWSNRPRDLANLTRFARQNTERAMNWQVVTFAHGWEDWMNCPVLYIASHEPPQFTDEQLDMLRHFVEAGGLLFTNADADSKAFTQWVADTLVPRICPGGTLAPLADGHPIFHVNYKIAPGAVKLLGVGNGSRLLLVHSPRDLGNAWQGRYDRVRPDDFRIGVNIFLYAAGKGALRNRLDSPIVPIPPNSGARPIAIARLSYAGNWNPEPFGWTQFTRACQWDTGARVAPRIVDLAALKPGIAPLAYLTGAASQDFTAAQVNAIRNYVQSGGVLLIDPSGGSGDFIESVKQHLLAAAFPGEQLKDIRQNHPLLLGLSKPGQDPAFPHLRPYAADRLNAVRPHVQLLTSGKGAVILSPLDLGAGLTGATTWPLLGYTPASSTRLAENVVTWSQTR